VAEAAQIRESATTIDPGEVAQFSAMAAEWWDPDGKFRPLHRFNPVRLGFLRDQLCRQFNRDPKQLRPLHGLTILDVGCGGGLISEPLARMGATVTGIDASEKNIGTAQAHAAESGLSIEYQAIPAEELVSSHRTFDAVIALEIVEHVADLNLFAKSCATLARPGGLLVFATLNRTPKSWLFAIVGAEYVLRWLPRGTHRWDKFVRPSELAGALEEGGAAVQEITGVTYDPLQDEWRLGRDVAVNYLMVAHKP
jgi:2-polyprenyl-6-hydroxyphenyl methylase / 3-demethylubiquinone-9 3-methyltransferase